MISRDNESRILAAEEFAPQRLRRADVAHLRLLFQSAHEALRAARWEKWTGDATVFLMRGKGAIALGRLGQDQPRVWVHAKWYKVHEVGLDVKVQAFAFSGRFISENIHIGDHRFRVSSTEAQFTREVSHLVRLGLGWCRHNSGARFLHG